MKHIPRRSFLYGLTAAGHILFSLVFPFFSVPLVIWLMERNLYRKSIMAFAAPFAGLFIYYTYRRWHLLKNDRHMLILVILSALIYVAIFETVPDLGEKLHVLNFSLMALVIYKALSPVMKIHWAMVFAWFVTCLVGGLDEYLQNFIVGRAGTVHDFLITVRSGVIGIIIGWIFDAYSRKGRHF